MHSVWAIKLLLFIFVCEVTCQSGNDIESNDFYRVGRPTSGSTVHPHPMSFVGSTNELHSMVAAAAGDEENKSGDKVTDILHGLLSKYDNRIRPFYLDTRVFVSVSFGGLQVVDVVEGKRELSSIVLLQQTWTDPRLAFEDETDEETTGIDNITINHEHTRELWLPDTFFENEKKPQGHESTMTNDAVILHKNGTVMRSLRLTVNTHCEFEYKDFPFDSQVCTLEIGSHAYRTSDIMYGWDEQFAMDVEYNYKKGNYPMRPILTSTHTGKFVVTGIGLSESTQEFNYGKMSRILFRITLQRAWKSFITRFYLPMVLFVFVSLGTMFFGDFRIALIVNLFNLGFVNIFVAIRSTSSDLPTTTSASSPSTAYDTYFITCLCYITLVLIVTISKLVKASSFSTTSTTRQSYAIQQPSSSSSGNHHNFPETMILRPNRRISNDHDIFNPMSSTSHEESSENYNREENGGGGGGGGDSELQQIYRSTSYPVRVNSKWRVAGRKVVKFGGWVWKYLRWILIVAFLLTDYIYFKIHSVQYS